MNCTVRSQYCNSSDNTKFNHFDYSNWYFTINRLIVIVYCNS